MTSLFDAVTVSDLPLSNRIVMAPMTRTRSDALGLATTSMATYYAQRAGAGLVVSEAIHPSRSGQSAPRTPGLYTIDQVESWRKVTSAVHRRGGRIFAQIMHAGRISHADTTGHQPVAPSAVAANVSVSTPSGPQPAPIPRKLTTAEVAEETATYASAAWGAIESGFDGVELHGGDGYLISQFLSSNANLRTDKYGGSIAGRIRFVVEAVAAAADAVGAYRVGLRLSPGAGLGDTVDTDIPELYGALLAALAPLGIAYIHLSASTDDDVLVGLRRAWPGTLIMNPSTFGSPVPADRERAERWLARGADLVSFGRAFLANPDLVERLRSDHPLNPADPSTFYDGGDSGYLTYPELSADTRYLRPPASA